MKYTNDYLVKAGKLTTMSDLNERIAKLEEKEPTTPINLSELEARITNLEATAKKWEIVSLTGNYSRNPSSITFDTIPSHLRNGYNFIIFEHPAFIDENASIGTNASRNATSTTGRFVRTKSGPAYKINATGGVSFKISGSSIIATPTQGGEFPLGNYNGGSMTIKVMFYK